MLGINEVHFGDCLELMKDIDAGSVDMILCDLPYGRTKNPWDVVIPFDRLWVQYERIVKPNGVIVLFGSGIFSARLILSNEKMYRYSLVYQKTTPTGHLNAKKMPMRSHEDIHVFYKKLPTYNPQKTFGHERKISSAEHKRSNVKYAGYGDYKMTGYDSTERYPTSVLKFSTDRQKSKLHATQKPLALIEYLVKTYSNPGDLVLDNCSGSGTTGLATKNLGRNYIMMENDPISYEISHKRVK